MEIILDVVLIALVALMVVVGIKRGLVKTCVGLVSTILVLVVAITAVTPLTNLVMVATEWDESLQNTLETPLADVPNAYAKVYYYDIDEDGAEKELVFEIDGETKEFDKIFEENAVLNFLKVSNLLEKNIDGILQDNATANGLEDYKVQENSIDFIDGVTAPIVTIIFTAVIFIVLLIGTRIVIALLLKLLQKIISRLYIVHFVDKMLGGVFGLVAGALFVLIALTIVQLLSQLSFMEPVNVFISKTIVTQFLMEQNFLYELLVNTVNLGEIMGNLGK